MSKKIRRGGALEHHGLPPCTIVSCFPITDHYINFTRLFRSPMDCVISGLQYIGVLDADTANLMRITTIGSVGINQEQIELMFAVKYRNNYSFKPYTNFDEFAQTVVRLPMGNILFAGYETDAFKHVFILVNLDGRIFYMDPQTVNCDILDTANCAAPFIIHGKRAWYLLHQSETRLTPFQEQIIIEHVNDLQHRVPLRVVQQAPTPVPVPLPLAPVPLPPVPLPPVPLTRKSRASRRLDKMVY